MYKRGEKNYAVIIEFGYQPAQRCRPCKRYGVHWLEGAQLDRCPRCGGPLVDVRLRRREWYGSFEKKNEAEAKKDELMRDGGAWFTPRSDVTVSKFLSGWLAGLQARGGQATTGATFATLARVYVIPAIGRDQLQGLTSGRLDGLYSALLEKGGRAGKGLSPGTVRSVHGMLHLALKDAVRQRLISRSPADEAARIRPASRELNTWTGEQVLRFLGHVADHRHQAAFVLLATTGARRGEVLGLKWSDLDLAQGQLSIRRSLVRVGNGSAFSTPKTKRSTRQVALDPTTVAVLREHRKRQLEERLLIGAAFEDQDLVFCTVTGCPVTPDSFAKTFRRQARAAGLPLIRVHDLRHTHATLALQAGVHPKVVQERLGHASVGFTLDVYSAVVESMQVEAASTIAGVIFGSQKVATGGTGGTE